MTEDVKAGAIRSANSKMQDVDLVLYENHGQDSRIKEVDTSPQINAKAGTGGG